MASAGEEGRGKLRKAPGICKQELIRRCPNGVTRQAEGLSALFYECSVRGELKHLSTRRKRKKISIPGVVAIETGRAQTIDVTAYMGL